MLIYCSAVLALGIIAQWVSWKLKLPSILLLLVFGFALGELYLRPDDVLDESLLFPVVALSVALILFEGGLSLKLLELREAGAAVLRLCTVGVFVSWLLGAAAAWLVAGLDLPVAMLLGAILVVTGPTVVAPLLRTIKPSRKVASVVKWEGIVIDPIGATLAVLVFSVIAAASAQQAAIDVIGALAKTLAIGLGVGWVAVRLVIALFKRHAVPDYLHSVFLLVVTAVVYTASDLLQHESGLLTVTVLGVVLANQDKVPVKHVIEFKENLRILLISTLFIVLSGRVSFDEFAGVGIRGAAFLAVILFAVRPLSVFLSTAGTGLSGREKVFLSLLAPRGIVAAAVTSVFALELAAEAKSGALPARFAEQSAMMVPLTFTVIVGTVLFCGLFSAPLARRLGISSPSDGGVLFGGASPWVQSVALALKKEGFAVSLIDSNQQQVRESKLAGLDAHRGSVVGEFVEHLDLAGIGTFVAATPNDEVNALAVSEFAHRFGRANTFQLEREQGVEAINRDLPASHFRGRVAFDGHPTFAELAAKHEAGYEAKVTLLTDRFTYDDFRQTHGGRAVLLFVIDTDGELKMADGKIEPGAGWKLVSLVDDNG